MPNADSKKRSRSPSVEADNSNTDKHHHKRVNVGTDAAHPKAEPAPERPTPAALPTVDENDENGEAVEGTDEVAAHSIPARPPADFPAKPADAVSAAAAAASATASGATKPTAPTPPSPSAMIHMRCLIVTQDASIIIGKGGAHVNEIREKSGARVVVSESIPGNPERILNVSGPLDAVSKVKLHLTESSSY